MTAIVAQSFHDYKIEILRKGLDQDDCKHVYSVDSARGIYFDKVIYAKGWDEMTHAEDIAEYFTIRNITT